MFKHWLFVFTIFVCNCNCLFAQSLDSTKPKEITLAEIRIRNTSDSRAFIEKIKDDSTFYKAFRNLRILSFTSLNDITLFNKKGDTRASMKSRTHQTIENGCRLTKKMEETVTGDFYDKNGNFNYYTAELYSSLFFAFQKVCGETNIVKG